MTQAASEKLLEAPYWGFSQPSIGEESYGAWFKPSYVYVFASGRDSRPVKIGYAGDIAQRIKAFEAGNPYGLRAMSIHPTFAGIARQVERRVHDIFAAKALGREWFEVHADEAAAPIPRLCELGRFALEAYRDAIINEPARMASVEEEAEQRRRFRRIVNSTRAHIGLERAERRLQALEVPKGRGAKLARYKLARGIA